MKPTPEEKFEIYYESRNKEYGKIKIDEQKFKDYLDQKNRYHLIYQNKTKQN